MRRRRRRRCRRWRAPRNGRSRRILLRRAPSGPEARGGGTPSASSHSSEPLLDSHSCRHTYRCMLREAVQDRADYTHMHVHARTSHVKRLSSTETPCCLSNWTQNQKSNRQLANVVQESRTSHQQGGNSWIIPTGRLNCSHADAVEMNALC